MGVRNFEVATQGKCSLHSFLVHGNVFFPLNCKAKKVPKIAFEAVYISINHSQQDVAKCLSLFCISFVKKVY